MKYFYKWINEKNEFIFNHLKNAKSFKSKCKVRLKLKFYFYDHSNSSNDHNNDFLKICERSYLASF